MAARRDTAKLLSATLLGTMDSNAIVPIIALYAASLGADLVTIGIIVGLYSAVHAPANLLFGRIADRFGRVRPMRLGLLWDAASMVLYAIAPNPLFLALARVSHGIGGGLVGPATMSLATDTARAGRRGRGMALYGMSIALAVILGTGLAGPLTRGDNFLRLFVVLAGALLLGFVISLRIKEPAAALSRPRVSLRRVLAYASRPGPAAGYAAIFTLYFLLGAFTALVPLHLRDELGYGTLEVRLSFTVFAILSLLLHYPAGILADRRGPATPALIGIAATAAAMAIIPIVRDIPALVAVMALFGVGHGFVFPSASALVTREADPGERGIVTGLFYSLLVAGVAIGAPTMAAIASLQSSYAFGIWASSWFVFFGIPFVVRAIRRPSREIAPDPEAQGTADSGNNVV